MIDPYGDDEIDYELDHDLRNLRCLAVDVATSLESSNEASMKGKKPQLARAENELAA